MRKMSKVTIALLCVITMLGVALATIWVTKDFSNSMKLSATYGFELYEHDTTVTITGYAWGNFAEGESKEFVFDLKYTGNVQGNVFWSGNVPSGWTLTVQEKNHDASQYNDWLSGESNQITGLDTGHLKNVKLILTETTAVPDQAYSFSISFNSVTY